MAMTGQREKVVSLDGSMQILGETGAQYIVSRPLPYGEFLLRINKVTNLPIDLLHESIWKYHQELYGELNADLFNENSVAVFVQSFKRGKQHLQGRFSYAKSSSGVGATALTRADGTV